MAIPVAYQPVGRVSIPPVPVRRGDRIDSPTGSHRVRGGIDGARQGPTLGLRLECSPPDSCLRSCCPLARGSPGQTTGIGGFGFPGVTASYRRISSRMAGSGVVGPLSHHAPPGSIAACTGGTILKRGDGSLGLHASRSGVTRVTQPSSHPPLAARRGPLPESEQPMHLGVPCNDRLVRSVHLLKQPAAVSPVSLPVAVVRRLPPPLPPSCPDSLRFSSCCLPLCPNG